MCLLFYIFLHFLCSLNLGFVAGWVKKLKKAIAGCTKRKEGKKFFYFALQKTGVVCHLGHIFKISAAAGHEFFIPFEIADPMGRHERKYLKSIRPPITRKSLVKGKRFIRDVARA